MNRNRRHYWQLFLFVLVLILPSVLVAMLGWRIVTLDRENRLTAAEKSARDARSGARTEIGKDAWARLENIKLQEIAKGAASDPAVRFVAWADGQRLVMPWETDPNAEPFRLAIKEPAFVIKIEEAEHAERERPPDRARALYVDMIQTAGNDSQRAYARLKLAAVLSRLGAPAEATGILRDLLSQPSSLVDEEGYSFASIAAGGLVNMNTAGREVFDRVSRDMESPNALTLDQTRRLRDILTALQDSGNASLRADAKGALDALLTQIANLEKVKKDLEQDRELLELRKDFPNLVVTEKTWQPYGNDLLISRAPANASFRPLVIAVRRESVFEAIRASRTSGPPFEIAAGGDSGESLDEQHLPGLKVIFPTDVVTAPIGLDLQRLFYASILLVVSLNLFGGYLLWRDTRREMRVAELRSQFVSSVSHELKTPLTAIRMFAEILQMGNVTDAQTSSECLDTIVNESERLTRLLNNVLDFSRIEHGQKNYHMEPTRLAEVVTEAAKTMQYPLAEQGFDLCVNVDDRIPAVEADRDALTQAVLNLLTNAMKYSGQSRSIELRLFPENGNAMIQVADHGIGIPAQEQSRIFERFYRAPVAENRSISGTGLGLALVAHIAEAHGGNVQVESTPGAGSTFSIRIPVHAGGPS